MHARAFAVEGEGQLKALQLDFGALFGAAKNAGNDTSIFATTAVTSPEAESSQQADGSPVVKIARMLNFDGARDLGWFLDAGPARTISCAV